MSETLVCPSCGQANFLCADCGCTFARRQPLPPTTLPESPGADTTMPYHSATVQSTGSGLLPQGYEILGELGRGGMGVVYRVRHDRLARVCALKMILAGAQAGDAQRERFASEAQAIARLQHPNIVQIFEVGEYQGQPFMALELCAGGSLSRRLREKPPTPKEAAEIVRVLALAMQAAHDTHVLHRDLKPANVLLTETGTPKITDFGLAKKLDEEGQTQTGAVMGTASYMPPEQARGEVNRLGPAADVYALGAILYECLTGRPPFRGATTMETLLQVLGNEPVGVRQLNPSVAADLETICHKCLRKDAGRRYGTAQELADDLGRYLGGQPIVARRVGVVERGLKWVRRNAVVSALAAAVALVLVAGAVVASAFAVLANSNAVTARTEATAARTAEKEAGDNLLLAERREQAEIAARKTALAEKTRADTQTERANSKATEATAALERARDQLARTELARYAGQLAQAQVEWQYGDPVRAIDILDECQWNLRQVEHRHLWTLFHSNQQTFLGHTREVVSVAFSPDGKRILTGSWDKTAKLWDADKGQEILTLKGHTGEVSSVAFSPDGKRVFAGTAVGKILAWTVADGKLADAADAPPLQPGSARATHGTLVAKAAGNTVVLVDLLKPPASDDFRWPPFDAAARKRYHGEQAAVAEKEKQWFALAFHLGRLLLDDPDNADLKQRRADALQKLAPK